MEYRVLGRVEAADRDRVAPITSPRQRALLGLLVVNAGRVVTTERILDELWGDEPPESGRDAVVFHVVRLRRALAAARERPGTAAGGGPLPADDPIETRDGGYRLAVDPGSIDAVRFERLVAAGEAGLAADPAAAAERLTEALELWRGEPYEGLDDLPFAMAEIRRLSELRLRATEDRLEADLALGRGPERIGELAALVDREPLREHLRALLIVALYRAGRQADALRAYGEGRRILAEELGIDPGPELAALETAILQQDPALLAGPLPTPGGRPVPDPAIAAAPPHNPYKGLRPFEEADAADFHGREALTDRLVTRLGEVARGRGLLAVVGSSGSGKSSVVRAGLVPALRSGALPDSATWHLAILFPGARPFEELAAALRSIAPDPTTVPTAEALAADRGAVGAAIAGVMSSGARLVLVIDQLEELWTLAGESVRATFLEALAAAIAERAGRLLVVATLRADHLDGALRSPVLGPLVRDGTELVPPLDHDELARAIERPAAGAGLVLEPGLAEAILAEVIDRPAMLPLLQYALTELAERADGGRLTRAAYAAIGGVVGALADRAEAAHAALEPAGRETARQVFLRLVAVEPTGEASVRRVARAELGDADAVDEVLERFGRARLLAHGRDARTGAPTVEIAHEALLARWPRLAGWVNAEREALWVRRRLGDAAAEWTEHDRDAGFLLSGARLELFAGWAEATDLVVGNDERGLLDASLAARDREATAERARAERERRLERRGTRMLQALVAVFAVAALVASGLLVVVWRQSEVAGEERAVATARELAVASAGRLDTQPDLALLLAVESARATAGRGWIAEEALDALHQAIQHAGVPYPTEAAPTAIRVLPPPDGPRGVYLLPADELIALAADAAGRTLTDDECAAYLHVEPCPDPADVGADLAVMTDGGRLAMADLAAPAAGTAVRVRFQLPGEPADLFAAFASESGISVNLLAAGGPGTDVAGGVARADIAILARPGDVAELARAGRLIDLRTILTPEEVARIEAAPLADLGYVGPRGTGAQVRDARLVGVPIAVTASSLLWYPADAFAAAGYEPPTTRTALEALVDRMIADDRVPWCLAIAGGEADGAGAVDLWEDLVIEGQVASSPGGAGGPPLRLGGPAGTAAFTGFRDLLTKDGAVKGGVGAARLTNVEWAAAQMGGGPLPRCWMVRDSSVGALGWISPVRSDLRPIPLPHGDGSPTLRARAYTLVVLSDRPEVRELVRHVLGSEFAERLAADPAGSGTVPVHVDADPGATAPDRRAVQVALAAAIDDGRLWIDLSDQMPAALGMRDLPAAMLRIAEADGSSVDQEVARAVGHLAGLSSPWTP